MLNVLENEFYEPDCITAIKLFLRRTLQRFVHWWTQI